MPEAPARRQDFPLEPGLTFLQTGSCGLMPEPVRRADAQRRERFFTQGPYSRRVSAWLARQTAEARSTIAGLLGAPPEDVAWIQNITTGYDCLALGLEWQQGDEVLALASEHPAGLMPFRRLERRVGVRLRLLPVPADRAPTADSIMAAAGPRTRLLVMSHVSYTTGAVAPVATVARRAREQGIITAVDGAQAAGLLPVDVAELGCDAYVACGYKWSLAPQGTAAVFMRPQLAEAIYPHRIGYFAVDDLQDDGHYTLREGAQKVQGTTYNALDFLAWADGIRYLKAQGSEQVWQHVRRLVAAFQAGLAQRPYLAPAGRPDAGLVTFLMPGRDLEQVVAQLDDEFGVVIRSVPYPRGLRISLHLYNDEGDLKRLFTALDAVAGRG